MEFKPSDPSLIGMELELQLLDAGTLDLKDGILPLMELYPGSPYVKPEFIQNTVEVASRICTSLGELESQIKSLISDLKAKCKELGMTLCGSGCHPFGQRLALVTPLPRYRNLDATSGLLSHTQITFATHVHMGMTSGDEAIAVMRELKAYLPLLIALSANSPFWRSYDTGYVSYRHRILAASRSYGIPPSFTSWNEFCAFLTTTHHARIFETVHDIHWDIRPRPHLGTLEIRVMDAQSSVSRAVALAGFVRTLLAYLRRTPVNERAAGLPKPLHWWLEKENHFQASRLGLGANYAEDSQGTVRPLRAVLQTVIEAIWSTAKGLDEAVYLERFREFAETDTGYAKQKSVYGTTESFKQVVASLVDELERDVTEAARGQTHD